ncbi:MAG: two-component system chemotaxis response regulator CheY [Polyangiales bacterium]|jgi:two-component system chemotaxis response regulator CheY
MPAKLARSPPFSYNRLVSDLRVLVVEDSKAMRAFVRAALEEELGAEVHEAASGLAALARMPREEFGLVIVDVNMPDLNGLELISFLRKQKAHTHTPVILMSTESSDRDRERGLALGANAFLSKPFGVEELCALVRKQLQDRG